PVGINEPGNFALNTQLKNNYPNPFIGTTTISFNVTGNQKLSLNVIDLQGRKAASLFEDKQFSSGAHEMVFDNNRYKLSPGIYFLQLGDQLQSESLKMVVTE